MQMPVKLIPSTKDFLWGGCKLKTDFKKQTECTVLAECWEISTHPDGPSIIAEGQYKGKTLAEYIKEYPCVLGTNCIGMNELPILVKLIDAAAPLSIQVHPDDKYAFEKEGQLGKTEMWYILDATPEAELIVGFKESLSKDLLRSYIDRNSLSEILQRQKVRKGDIFHIEPGTIHAIGAGIVLIEVQQNSNITYRVDDYGRRDLNGELRPLHLEKAMDVIQCVKANPSRNIKEIRNGNRSEVPMLSCQYFATSYLFLCGEQKFNNGPESFLGLICIEGNGELLFKESRLSVNKGDSFFIPADCQYALKGNAEFIKCSC